MADTLYKEDLLEQMLSGDLGVDYLDIGRALILANSQNTSLTSELNDSKINTQKHLEAMEQIIAEKDELRAQLSKLKGAIDGFISGLES